MKSFLKIALAVVTIIIAIPLIVILAAEVILNSAAVKSEIEQTVAEALEMAFKIEGRIDIQFFPPFNLAANNLTISIKSGQIASANRLIIDPRLIPLLSLDVQIKKASVQNARLNFNPGAIDKIQALVNAESSDEPLPVKSLVIESFLISGGAFAYTDDQTRIEISEMNFRGGRIDIIADGDVIIDDIYKLIDALDFSGDMKARQISTDDFKAENIRARLIIKNGRIAADPAQAQFLGSNTKLSAFLDLKQPHSTFRSSLVATGLDMKALAAEYFPAVNIRGKVDINTGISASGIELQPLIDYLSSPDQAAGTKKIPIKSVVVESSSLDTGDLNYINDSVSINQVGLKLKGDRWALIDNNRCTLTDFLSFLRATKISGQTAIERITVPDQLFENIRATLSNDHGVFRSDPIELEYFGEQARIGWAWDLRTGDIETIHLRVDMPELDTGRFFKRSEGKDILQGKLNIHADLITRGIYGSTMLENLNGRVYLKGTNLTLKKVDFDRALDEFKEMGAFGFSDFAALVTLGPLGAMVSNGYDQLNALEKMMGATGDSTIQKIVSDWSVVRGVALAGDVAFSTKRHRVAIAGKLDFPNWRLDKLTIAVVDSNGCIVNRETLDGPFESPEVKDTGVLQRTVIRPLKRMLKSDCVPFYEGAVPHPAAAPK